MANVKQVHQRQKGETKLGSLVGEELGIGQNYDAKCYKYVQLMPSNSLK